MLTGNHFLAAFKQLGYFGYVSVNFYFCQFLFFSLFIIKYCFWHGYIFVNGLPTAADKGICWRLTALII